MDRPRLTRWLRIAVSMVYVVVCLALVGLWVRSYSIFDSISGASTNGVYYSLMSQYGHITFVKGYNPNSTPATVHFYIGHKALEPFVGSPTEPKMSGFLGLHWFSSHGLQAFRELILALPHWFVAFLSAALVFVPWLPWVNWRFSLRTMLIVTAVVAVALGLVVWMVGR